MSATQIDFDARYRISGFGAIAFYLLGYATEWTEEEWIHDGEGDPDDDGSYVYCEPEEIEVPGMVRSVMVGDDREWTVDVADLEVLAEDAYCSCCGQIGCGWS